jgi:hypothetical protein
VDNPMFTMMAHWKLLGKLMRYWQLVPHPTVVQIASRAHAIHVTKAAFSVARTRHHLVGLLRHGLPVDVTDSRVARYFACEMTAEELHLCSGRILSCLLDFVALAGQVTPLQGFNCPACRMLALGLQLDNVTTNTTASADPISRAEEHYYSEALNVAQHILTAVSDSDPALLRCTRTMMELGKGTHAPSTSQCRDSSADHALWAQVFSPATLYVSFLAQMAWDASSFIDVYLLGDSESQEDMVRCFELGCAQAPAHQAELQAACNALEEASHDGLDDKSDDTTPSSTARQRLVAFHDQLLGLLVLPYVEGSALSRFRAALQSAVTACDDSACHDLG